MWIVALLVAQAAAPVSRIPDLKPVAGVPSLLESGLPEVPAQLRARIEQYQNSRSANALDVAADGSQLLIATRFASTNQLHLVEQPMGMRTQLTFGNEPVNSARFVPGDPRALLYLQDVGGGEFHQVFRLDRRTGRSELLTDGKSRHEGLVVSVDGTRFAYSGTGRNGKDTDVYLAQMAQPRDARRVTEREGAWQAVEFSWDGTRLLVAQFRAVDDSDLHLYDVKSGELRQITPREGKGSVEDAAFSADGKSVYLITDRYSDFNSLYRIDLTRPGSKPEPLTPQIKWDLEGLTVAPDGAHLAFAANQEGWSRVYLLDLRSGRAGPIDLPRGIVSTLRFPDRRADLLFVGAQTARSPNDVWAYSLKERKLTRWTRSEAGPVDAASFVEPELVKYRAADGIVIPAFLWKPPRADGKVPVVILWHGGPEGQSRPTFQPIWQFYAQELGIAVLAPNVRGSTGYGKPYLAMDNGVKREQALGDIGATLDFIASRTDLDASRVAAYGGSYGGYMTLATVAFQGARVRAAVDIVGISNLASFLQTTQAYRRDLRRAEYGDERDPAVRAVQERISPLNSVDKIEAALLVIQGKNDPRVPQSEAEQIVQALRARGKDAPYLLGLNEGHGFQKKENRDYMTAAAAAFLLQKLQRAPVPPG
ncbi:MAG TPA: prolyl oligopeptidase family serine peptidase [Myxococcales bacterium]|nr:prolyl oligopeptidase family serine peptidase [Myxococcales bacterium]